MRKNIIFYMEKNVLICMLVICVAALFTTGCKQKEPVSKQIFAMDTVMNLTVYCDEGQVKAEEILNRTATEIQALEDELSAEKKGSPVHEINETGEGVLGENGTALLSEALKIGAMTDNALDVTIYPLVKEWGFPSGELNIPSEDRIRELLAKNQGQTLSFHEETGEVRFLKGSDARDSGASDSDTRDSDARDFGLDFGAIAKGYTSDRVVKYWKEAGISAGIMSLGGNLQCFGTKPDGSKWICGIQDPLNPENPEKMLGVLKLTEGALVTSGPYQRYLTDETTGETYHHILNPKTGYPAESGLLSVTIFSESGAMADGLSTAVFVLGMDEGIRLWREDTTEFEMVLMTDDHQVYITEEIAKDFSSDYPVEVIRK